MKLKTFKRIFTALGGTVMVVCCGAYLLLNISGFGWKALAIPTGSMRPDIPPGSMVLVHRVPDSTLKVGDVITYTNPMERSQTITHRITKTYLIGGKVPGYITKGDANPSPDQPVVAGQVKGKVAWHSKYLGYPLIYSKDPIVILPIIYIAALMIMIEEIQRLAEYYRRFIVYRLPGYRREPENDYSIVKRVSMGGALTIAFVVIGLAISPTALAALRSNTVVLHNNRLSVAQKQNCGDNDHDKDDHGKCKDNDGKCDGDNDKDDKNCNNKCSSNEINNVQVNVNTTQNAKTGNANSQSGNANSGNATNSNSTTISLNASNC